MHGPIERAWTLAREAARATSPEAFADVVVDGLWDLIPSDDVVFIEIDEQTRALVLYRARPVLPVADALGRSRVCRRALPTIGWRYSIEGVFASPPGVRRAVVLARAGRDFSGRDRDLLALLLPHLEIAYRKARAVSLLTPRERDVLALVRQGLSNREIARHLDISPGTVRAHLEHAFPKLGVGSRTAAVAMLP